MDVQFKNNSFTTTADTIDEDDTELNVAVGGGLLLPTIGTDEYFYATLRGIDGVEEIIKVTAIVGDVLTIERAAEGTTAAPFLAGSLLENRFTAQTLRDVTELNYLLL